MDLPVQGEPVEIGAQHAIALHVRRGDVVCIVDRYGEQVADLALYNANDWRDGFSPGRTMDYNASVRLTCGDVLYSQRSTELARVVRDTVGVHDMLLAPCSSAMFARRGELRHRSCHENLANALAEHGVDVDGITATLNVFMNVRLAHDGSIGIEPPASRPGDVFAVQALCDLIMGISACSSELTNNGRCKAIWYWRSSALDSGHEGQIIVK